MRMALKLNRWKLILISVYLASSFILVIKIASPVNIRIVFQGEREIYEKEVLNLYTFTDMLIIAVAAVATSSSVLILLLMSNKASKTRLGNPELVLKTLGENEREIYRLILNMDGVAFQSELVTASKMSKSTVSIILDKLEGKGLIEKRRRGMGNIIIAKPIEIKEQD